MGSSCTTDMLGMCTLTYTASEVGGEELLMAASGVDPTVTDAQPLTIRVPGLGPLGVAPEYRLTGAPPVTLTTSVGKCLGRLITHVENHHGTFFLVQSIFAMATDYFSDPTTQATLGVNDMSLPEGGLFDICGDWEPPHIGHRNGTAVDVDGTAKDLLSGQSVAVRIDKLDEFACRHNLQRFQGEPQIHYNLVLVPLC